MAIYINKLQNIKNGKTAPDCPGNQFPAHVLPRVRGAYLANRLYLAVSIVMHYGKKYEAGNIETPASMKFRIFKHHAICTKPSPPSGFKRIRR